MTTTLPAVKPVAEATTIDVSFTVTALESVVVVLAMMLSPLPDHAHGQPRLERRRADENVQTARVLVGPDLVLADHANREAQRFRPHKGGFRAAFRLVQIRHHERERVRMENQRLRRR